MTSNNDKNDPSEQVSGGIGLSLGTDPTRMVHLFL